MSKKLKVCSACQGSGHDKASRPVIKFESYVDDEGKNRKRHITVAQGSGCHVCGGIGVK